MTKFNFNKDVLLEALKELGRVALIAALPILISQFETGKVDWRVIGIAGIVAVLKAVDKGLHLYGVEKENSLELGLTRF